MRAMTVTQFGPPEVMLLRDMPVPEPGEWTLSLWRRDAAAFRETLAAQSIDLKDFQGQRRIPLALAEVDGKRANLLVGQTRGDVRRQRFRFERNRGLFV